jgi:hypothetical protein
MRFHRILLGDVDIKGGNRQLARETGASEPTVRRARAKANQEEQGEAARPHEKQTKIMATRRGHQAAFAQKALLHQ